MDENDDAMRVREPGEDGSSVSRAALLAALMSGSSLASAVPAALEIVARDPLVRAASFEGDLLRALMEVSGDFWSHHPRLYDEYRAAVRNAAAARRRLPAHLRLRFWSPLSGPS
jgi:CDI immunity proteins